MTVGASWILDTGE